MVAKDLTSVAANPLLLKEDDLRAFVGANADSYAAYLQKSQERGRLQTPFLWTAFFFPLVWLAYRKFYLGIAIFIGAVVAITVVQEFVRLPDVVDRWIGPAMAGGVAVSAKYFVVTFAAKYAGKADAQGLIGDARRTFLAEHGGTSWISALLAGIFTLGVAGWVAYTLWGSEL